MLQNLVSPEHVFSNESLCGSNAQADMKDLERSHVGLRAAVILAGRRVRQLNFDKQDDPVSRTVRRVLREARIVAKS